ncbi:MAG TPA: glycosyltransferase family 2 protein [Steroidobacteraceae bacterium]|nr:glycosyltransferase family 2 protein [Steroidobacteraceae bacterium]
MPIPDLPGDIIRRTDRTGGANKRSDQEGLANVPMRIEDPSRAIGPPRLSVIVPVFDEQDNIDPLYASIVRAVEPLGVSFEIVLVDDGSTDLTHDRAVNLARADSRVRIVKFRRNYGQTAAMAAGVEHAAGTILITMDGDLQNDPADIERFLAEIEQGFDIVVGWRHQRQDKLLSRRIPSRIANWIIGKVTGVPIRDNGCSLKAYRASVIKAIPLYSEMHRFIPAMASIAGPRIAEIKVRHHARRFGKSKYGLSRIYKVMLDLLVVKTVISFTSRPLLWFSLLSLPAFFLAALAFGYTAVTVLIRGAQFPLPVAGSGFIFSAGAIMLMSSGAIGELVFRLGDVRERDFARLTARSVRGRSTVPASHS